MRDLIETTAVTLIIVALGALLGYGAFELWGEVGTDIPLVVVIIAAVGLSGLLLAISALIWEKLHSSFESGEHRSFPDDNSS